MNSQTDSGIAVVSGASGGIGRTLSAALCRDPGYPHVVGLSRPQPSV